MIKEINGDTFAERIVGMMADYEITMFDALLWDFESFGFDSEQLFKSRGINSLERSFRVYLVKNGIDKVRDEDFYTDVFMGRSNNLGLNKNAKTENE